MKEYVFSEGRHAVLACVLTLLSCAAELVLQDVDGDGLMDVQMEDGSWVGYSLDTQTWVRKSANDTNSIDN